MPYANPLDYINRLSMPFAFDVSRLMTLIGMFAFTLLVACSAQVNQTTNQALEGQDAELLSELLQTKVDLDLREADFVEAMDQFADQTGRPFVIDPELAEVVGLAEPKKLTVRLANAPFDAAFRTVFEQAVDQEAALYWPLPVQTVWRIEGGIATFGPAPIVVQIYDVRDLFSPPLGDTANREFTEEQRQAIYQQQTDQIVELLTSTVGKHEHWSDRLAGTPLGGTITGLNGVLIIKTTHNNHNQLLGVFERLRATPREGRAGMTGGRLGFTDHVDALQGGK